MSHDTVRLIRGRIYNRRKKTVGKKVLLDQVEPISTAQEVAVELGISAPTVKRNGQQSNSKHRSHGCEIPRQTIGLSRHAQLRLRKTERVKTQISRFGAIRKKWNAHGFRIKFRFVLIRSIVEELILRFSV